MLAVAAGLSHMIPTKTALLVGVLVAWLVGLETDEETLGLYEPALLFIAYLAHFLAAFQNDSLLLLIAAAWLFVVIGLVLFAPRSIRFRLALHFWLAMLLVIAGRSL